MASGGDISRENGKKGGRPKAAHTITAEKGKALLIQMYLEQVRPINQALIDKALTGDVPAIRELHDRTQGKANQSIDIKGNLTISQVLDELDGSKTK